MSEEAVLTPITPEEGGNVPPKVTPFKVPEAAPTAPAASAPAASGPATIKLKPVIRKPMIRKPVIGGAPKPEAPAAPEASASAPAAAPVPPSAPAPAPQASKKATQSLGAVTGDLPAQAVLRKTGIIAEGIITPAQKQAAKSRTSRISLESAIGVAPAKESAAPMKTIKLRRPTNLRPAAPSILKPAAPAPAPEAAPAAPAPIAEAAPAAEPAPVAPVAETAEPDAAVTQKKTLKLQRPASLGIKRPSLGVQKPALPAAEGDVGDLPALDPVGDIPELKPLSPLDMAAPAEQTSAGVPAWVTTLSLVTTLAALLVLGVVMYFLWSEGCGPVAGPNEMPFLQM
jgi:hypothetical protein